MPGVGDALKMLSLVGGAKLSWKKRYLRLFAGKLEWYEDNSLKSYLKPKGFAPLGTFDIDYTPPRFRKITSTYKYKIGEANGASPCDHKRYLQVNFTEYGEIKYRIGLGAHNAEYWFMPEAEEECQKLENAIDKAADAVANMSDEATQAAFAALTEGKNPINAALAHTMEKE